MNTTLKKIDLPNLVLDLDDVLLHEPSQEITEEHTFFLKKSFLAKDSYGYSYIVPAYLSEFLKFATSRFNVSFFSSGDGERNRSVVQDIWLKVFGIGNPESVQVLCRKSLTRADDKPELQPTKDGCHWFGNNKKDITKLGELHNTILADDDKSWVLSGQKPNFLQTPGHFWDFQPMVEKHKNASNYSQIIEECLTDKCKAEDLLAFYKLLYIAGLLDKAAQHATGIVDGLYAAQFENNEPKFYERMKEIEYYKRGYAVLSGFLDETSFQYFPEIEKHFLQ